MGKKILRIIIHIITLPDYHAMECPFSSYVAEIILDCRNLHHWGRNCIVYNKA